MKVAGLTATAMLLTPAGALAHDDHGDESEPLVLYSEEESFSAVTAAGEVVDLETEEEDSLPELGDQFFLVDALHSTPERNDWVGRNNVSCTFTELAGEFPSEEEFEEGGEVDFFRITQSCEGVVTLYGQGTLTWAGLITFDDEDLEAELAEDFDPYAEPFATVAITGGTRELIGASGQAEIFDEEAPDEDTSWGRYEVTLLP